MILLATAAGGPASTTSRRHLVVLARRVKRLINGWVAAVIAHRERQAAMATLNYLTDRELKDMGLYRGQIYEMLKQSAKAQSLLSH